MSGAALDLATRFAAEHPGEAARGLEGLGADDAAAFLVAIPEASAAGLLAEMMPAIAASAVVAMDEDAAAEVLALLPGAQRVRVLRYLGPAARSRILARLPTRAAVQVERGLRYPLGSAGAFADSSIVPLPADMTVAAALRTGADARLQYVYVVDRRQRLAGVLHRRDLRSAEPGSLLSDVMSPQVERIPAAAPIVTVMALPAWRELDALPVVDAGRIYIGAIRHRDLRRLGAAHAASQRGHRRAPIATLLDLGELYWSGMGTVVSSLASEPGPPAGEEADHA